MVVKFWKVHAFNLKCLKEHCVFITGTEAQKLEVHAVSSNFCEVLQPSVTLCRKPLLGLDKL